MTTFIIAAITADGFIAKDLAQSPLSWRSKGDRNSFIEKTKKPGLAVIMGLNAAKASKKPLPGRQNIIYCERPEDLPNWKEYSEWEVTQKEPAELLNDLERRGFSEVAVCGGSYIYTMFMKSGLVQKLYLTVEPWFFGKGISLFREDLNQKLELVSCKNLEKDTILLEYNVMQKETQV